MNSQSNPDYHYIGTELELFAKATNWKAYLKSQITPWIGARTLEVGAGIGTTTQALFPTNHKQSATIQSWICLEPDPQLGEQLRQRLGAHLPPVCQARLGTVADLETTETYDSILYIDVLEHIELDRQELEKASLHLNPGGRLIVLSPAHQWLFSPFDQAIGHFRRYSKATLKALKPPQTQSVRLRYLDSVGMLASLGNRLLLQKSMPKPSQIALWNKMMVPCSRFIDPLFGWTLGKSILSIWEKTP